MFEYCNRNPKGIGVKIGEFLSHKVTWVDDEGDLLPPSVINGWDRYSIAKDFVDSYINNKYLNDMNDKYRIIGGESNLSTFIQDVAYKIDEFIPKRYFIKYCQIYNIYDMFDGTILSQKFKGKDKHGVTKNLVYHYRSDCKPVDNKREEYFIGVSEKQLNYIKILLVKTEYKLKNIDKLDRKCASDLIEFLMGNASKPTWARRYLGGKMGNPIDKVIKQDNATEKQLNYLNILCAKRGYILKNTDDLSCDMAHSIIDSLKVGRRIPKGAKNYLERIVDSEKIVDSKKEDISVGLISNMISYSRKGLKDYIYLYLLDDVKWVDTEGALWCAAVINSWDRLTMSMDFIELKLKDAYVKSRYMNVYKESDEYGFIEKIALLIDELIPKAYFTKYIMLNGICEEYIDKDSHDITKDLIYRGIDGTPTQKQLDYLEDLAYEGGYNLINTDDLTCDIASKLINFLKGGTEPDCLFDYLEYDLDGCDGLD